MFFGFPTSLPHLVLYWIQAKLRIWKVPACKMKPQIVFLCVLLGPSWIINLAQLVSPSVVLPAEPVTYNSLNTHHHSTLIITQHSTSLNTQNHLTLNNTQYHSTLITLYVCHTVKEEASIFLTQYINTLLSNSSLRPRTRSWLYFCKYRVIIRDCKL